ncbi:FIG00554872: hypothetical protein [Cronobacter sakazakii 696]|nr:FIG00554872: hypothetical protein [Cronobacter sakazakii 696]
MEVADSIAERWVNAGLAEYLEERQLEVATPKRGRKPKDKE